MFRNKFVSVVLLFNVVIALGVGFVAVKVLSGEEVKLPKGTEITLPAGATFEEYGVGETIASERIIEGRGGVQDVTVTFEFPPGCSVRYQKDGPAVKRPESFRARTTYVRNAHMAVIHLHLRPQDGKITLDEGWVEVPPGGSWGAFLDEARAYVK